MNRKPLLAVLALSLAAPAGGGDWALPPAQALVKKARMLGQDSADQALAALYGRLFKLQDLKRDAELRIDTADFVIGDLVREYKRHDRYVDTPQELREIASDPEHRSYPNPTESSKLKILAETLTQIRVQELGRLELRKLERDIEDAKKLIAEHLLRRPVAG